ncbi:MAG: isoprenylcysteine carboxylmethyltransferase family protein [Oscillibacter sp.]|jgi:protein-S-isoprenylcysteine O-methyltransferase Ste14|nr:isoprenylcysteine carboxylmethyltransferase family protein [Oscillibacter sp.]
MERALGFAVLAAFYIIYFGKLIAQRRRGIRTHQIGKGQKPRSVMAVEKLLSFSTCAVTVVEIICLIFCRGTDSLGLLILGAVLGIAGDTVFAVSVYTMRDSWRAGIPAEDRTQLVTTGIYCFSRNPAFLGFDLTYLSILVLCFHPVLLLFTMLAIVSLHLQILQEEIFLTGVFDDSYRIYCRKTGRYLGCKRI